MIPISKSPVETIVGALISIFPPLTRLFELYETAAIDGIPGVGLGLGDAVGVGLGVPEGVDVGVGVGVRLGLGVGVGLPEGAGVGEEG